jgi:hypothetical protein
MAAVSEVDAVGVRCIASCPRKSSGWATSAEPTAVNCVKTRRQDGDTAFGIGASYRWPEEAILYNTEDKRR